MNNLVLENYIIEKEQLNVNCAFICNTSLGSLTCILRC